MCWKLQTHCGRPGEGKVHGSDDSPVDGQSMVAQRAYHRVRHVDSSLPLPLAPFPAAYEARKPSAVLGVVEDPGLARLQHLVEDPWATAAAGIRETARPARGSVDSRRPGWTARYSRTTGSKAAMMRLAGWQTGDESVCHLPGREAKEALSSDLASFPSCTKSTANALFYAVSSIIERS